MEDKKHFLNSVSFRVFVGVVGLSLVIGTVGGLLIGGSRQAATSVSGTTGTPGIDLSCSILDAATIASRTMQDNPGDPGDEGSEGSEDVTTKPRYRSGQQVSVGLSTLKAKITYPDPSWYNPFNTTTKVVNVPFEYAPIFWTAVGGTPASAPTSGNAEDALNLSTFSTAFSTTGDKTISSSVRFSSDDVQNYLENLIEEEIGVSLPNNLFEFSLSASCSYGLTVYSQSTDPRQSPIDSRKNSVENQR